MSCLEMDRFSLVLPFLASNSTGADASPLVFFRFCDSLHIPSYDFEGKIVVFSLIQGQKFDIALILQAANGARLIFFNPKNMGEQLQA